MARARVTNGKELLPGIDGRSLWVRRLRDLNALHIADLGGDLNVSEAERAILRRACCLIVELERMECKFALAGEGSADQLNLYQRMSNTLRRNLESLGLSRRTRDITPTLDEYVRSKGRPNRERLIDYGEAAE